MGSFAHNCNHFTGKTKGLKPKPRKHKVKLKQQPHENKYKAYSKTDCFKKELEKVGI